ncbi:GNAT family N-acetyltransferase [Sphingomonas olei]|uniref:GNAT family N-acetyltransferase n=1 Tax=Sphingomonas olei TaxID=1886787 RepID=A0ABY2QLY0_9SPHN|nr:GNAT family N-acetyltransferase [Sphingomonas olei]THG42253.1 GNAT family N-acetyltransferase [Sphingomonas olei]
MFARTKRLTLRPGWPEEAERLQQTIAHEEVAMKLARLPWPYTHAVAEAFLSMPRGEAEARFLILSHDHDYPRMIGGIGLTDQGVGVAELGYWLTPSAWGRGYATEAARAVVDMARHALPVRRIEARHHLDNLPSRRVLEKLGFREIRREASFSLAQGRAVDSAVLALDMGEEEEVPARMAIAA